MRVRRAKRFVGYFQLHIGCYVCAVLQLLIGWFVFWVVSRAGYPYWATGLLGFFTLVSVCGIYATTKRSTALMVMFGVGCVCSSGVLIALGVDRFGWASILNKLGERPVHLRKRKKKDKKQTAAPDSFLEVLKPKLEEKHHRQHSLKSLLPILYAAICMGLSILCLYQSWIVFSFAANRWYVRILTTTSFSQPVDNFEDAPDQYLPLLQESESMVPSAADLELDEEPIEDESMLLLTEPPSNMPP